jgi:uncharacterized membrane protein YeiB
MALTSTVPGAGLTERDRTRLPGPDVVRAVALIGVVVMNYHGYLIIAGGDRGDGTGWSELFDPWTGPLSTRFAATFVLTAGVGVTLLTRSARTPAAITARRWTLLRRGLVLFVLGWIVDATWEGTILPYYGALFMLAAVLFTLSSPALAAIGAGAALAGAAIAWWGLEQRLAGHDTGWLFQPERWSPHGLVLDTFVNGTHPLLPWLAFFCAGIVLGRLLATPWWRTAAFAAGFSLYGLAVIIAAGARTGTAGTAGTRARTLASTDPFDRGLLYTASALGTALVAFAAISWLAERFAASVPVDVLRHAGAMTLTLYLLHILVFRLAVDGFGLVEPGGLGTSLTFAAAFWAVAIAGAWWYHRRVGIGPAEYVYRRLGG